MIARYGLLTAWLALGAVLAQLGCAPGGPDPVVERNKAATKRFFIEVMNQGRFDLIDGMFAPDYTLEGKPFPDSKKWAEALKQKYPDLEFVLEGLIGEGNQVAVWWILDLHDPNHQAQRLSGINLLTFGADGRLQSNWEGDLGASAIPDLGSSAGGPAYPEAWLSNNGQLLDGYSGDRFQLVYDYPTSAPPKPDDPWNRAARWPLTPAEVVPYMTALRAYVYDSLLPVDFRPERIQRGPDGLGGWYHEPWLSGIYPATEEKDNLPTWCGRDFVRGLYFGTPLPPSTIPGQEQAYRNYEIVLYNDVGGYHLGRVWNAGGSPSFGDFQFPDGTVIVKLVLTTAKELEVLRGAPRWTAYLPSEAECKSPALTELALIQLDVVLKDSAHSPETGWIFTTYVYDADHPSEDPWLRMVPLGAMWGDDPGVMPGGELAETVIAPEAPEWFSANLGFGGRLSGPIDLAKGEGSCLSCHATSEFSLDPAAKLEANFVPPPNTPDSEKMARWFRNLPGDTPWSGKQGGWMALDYSFVTLGSLAHYHTRADVSTAPSVLRDRERF